MDLAPRFARILVCSALLALPLIFACGSSSSSSSGSGSSAPPTALAQDAVVPPDATVATAPDAASPDSTPVPDPITKPLTEPEARREAARHAAAAFVKRTDLVHPDGTRVLPTFDPKDFQGGLVRGRWTFEINRPAGATVSVSFGKFGEDVKAQASYASE